MNLWNHRYSQNTNKKLSRFQPSLHRAEILTFFLFAFGRNGDFINSIWNCLTFRRTTNQYLRKLVSQLDFNSKNLDLLPWEWKQGVCHECAKILEKKLAWNWIGRRTLILNDGSVLHSRWWRFFIINNETH